MGKKSENQALFIDKKQVPVQGRCPNTFALASAKPNHKKFEPDRHAR